MMQRDKDSPFGTLSPPSLLLVAPSQDFMNNSFSSNIPSLVPVASPTEEETDSFLGQSCSPPASGHRSVASSYFSSDNSNNDLFVVSETSPPLANNSRSISGSGHIPMIQTNATNVSSHMQPPLPPPIPTATASSEPYSPLSRPADPLQPPSIHSGMQFNSVQTPPGVTSAQVPMMAPPLPPPASTIQGGVGGVGSVLPYQPVRWHWFFSRIEGISTIWRPFSAFDSTRLENAWMAGRLTENIATDGGRYDVRLNERRRYPVYWEENPTEIRRCSWFYRPEGDTRYVPYDERLAQRLEGEFMRTVQTAAWHRRLEIAVDETGRNEVFVFHNPQAMVHYRGLAQPADEYGITGDQQSRPCVVKRGLDSVEDFVDEGEYQKIDHVIFVVHGIGSVCDLRGRNLVECVDQFRSISNGLIKSHFPAHAGRVEYLPVHWHGALHGEATGLDQQLRKITLGSIPKLRNYTNDTLIDILFYTSPKYCQTIVDTVAGEVNRLHGLFLLRNPQYNGTFSIAGHSLGSVIAFDLLAHQGDAKAPPQANGSPATSVSSDRRSRSLTPVIMSGEAPGSENASVEASGESLERLFCSLGLPSSLLATFESEQVDLESLHLLSEADLKELGVPLGPRKKILGFMKAREQKKIEKEEASVPAPTATPPVQRAISLPTEVMRGALPQQEVVNFVVGTAGVGQPLVSFPPLDLTAVSHFFALGSPIALFLTTRGIEFLGEEYRLPICRSFFNIFHPFDPVAYRMETMIRAPLACRPVLIPHHKGRKRMHLELKENLARVGADIKARIVDSLRSTWRSLHQFATAHRYQPDDSVDADLAVEQEVSEALSQMQTKVSASDEAASSVADEEVVIGQLNQGRRIDYVLQESPLESFNDYIFALSSHACYWDSEDTALLILKEVYVPLGVHPVSPLAAASAGIKKSASSPLLPPPPPLAPPPPSAAHFTSPAFSAASPPSLPPPPPPQPQAPAAIFPPTLDPPMPGVGGAAPPSSVFGSAPLLPRHGSLFRHK